MRCSNWEPLSLQHRFGRRRISIRITSCPVAILFGGIGMDRNHLLRTTVMQNCRRIGCARVQCCVHARLHGNVTPAALFGICSRPAGYNISLIRQLLARPFVQYWFLISRLPIRLWIFGAWDHGAARCWLRHRPQQGPVLVTVEYEVDPKSRTSSWRLSTNLHECGGDVHQGGASIAILAPRIRGNVHRRILGGHLRQHERLTSADRTLRKSRSF